MRRESCIGTQTFNDRKSIQQGLLRLDGNDVGNTERLDFLAYKPSLLIACHTVEDAASLII